MQHSPRTATKRPRSNSSNLSPPVLSSPQPSHAMRTSISPHQQQLSQRRSPASQADSHLDISKKQLNSLLQTGLMNGIAGPSHFFNHMNRPGMRPNKKISETSYLLDRFYSYICFIFNKQAFPVPIIRIRACTIISTRKLHQRRTCPSLTLKMACRRHTCYSLTSISCQQVHIRLCQSTCPPHWRHNT
jgi:hypothetical protein